MKRRLTDLELCGKYDNESQHTEYVTHLALALFDRTQPLTGLSPNDKRLLEAACRLHDVGYSLAEKNHAEHSADIILREGLSGFKPAERAIVANAILLHPGKRCRIPEALDAPGLKDRHKILQIAAFLRICDGLDHAHIQSASIVAVKNTPRLCQITVRDHVSQANIEFARLKADLWEHVFSQEVRIIHADRRAVSGPKFGMVLSGRESPVEYTRKLVCVLFRTAADNVDGTIIGIDPEHLHDLRVAIRRARAALRFFKPVLKKTPVADLREDIARLCDQLSLARDAQVWLEYLDKLQRKPRVNRDPRWREYLQLQQQKNDESLEDLRTLLRSEDFKKLLRQAAYFARVEIPRVERSRGRLLGSLKTLIAGRLRREYRKLIQTPVRFADMDPEALHAFRRQGRRVRYAAEFSAPALGKTTLRLERKLKALADALGTVHDMDSHVPLEKERQEYLPAVLVRHAERLRRQALRDAARVWAGLRGPRFRASVDRMLYRYRHPRAKRAV